MSTLANSEDPDEMLLRQKQSSEKERQNNFEVINCDNSIYGAFQVNCIKPEGRIHKCMKG